MKEIINTEYALGQVVKHKYLDFRGVIYDVDPELNNTEDLLVDDSKVPVEHPDVPVFFGGFDGASYEILENSKN